MGTIRKSLAGELTVQYDKSQFVGADEEIFKYAIASFAYLVPRNRIIFLSEFIQTITNQFDGDPRINAIKNVIEKAKIKRKFKCRFAFSTNGQVVNQAAKVDAESWHQVRELVRSHVGVELIDFEIVSVSATTSRGQLHYKAFRGYSQSQY